jgi:hypothetical protein
MFLVIHQTIRDARAQLHTGHQYFRDYFSDTTAAEPTTNATGVPTTPVTNNSPYRLPTTRHSPAISACENPARCDFNWHSPVISWAQRSHLSLTDAAGLGKDAAGIEFC